MSERRRVVITGYGAVTPLGADVRDLLGGRLWRVAPASGPSASFDASAGRPPAWRARCPTSTRRWCSTARRSGATTARPRWRSWRRAQAMDTADSRSDSTRRTRCTPAVVIGSGLGGTGTLIDQISVNATRGPDRL